MRARAIDAAGGERIARADLNRLMNVPLDRDWIAEDWAPPPAVRPDVNALVDVALRQRPEMQQAALRRDLSQAQRRVSAGALLPQAVAQAGYEWNDGRRGSPARAWIAAAVVRVSLFDGGANLARLREASAAEERAAAEQQRAEAAVRLDVWSAAERLMTAQARETVGRAAVAQARESERMIRDRYEAGMAPLADVIRAATAVLDAEAQRIGSIVDVIVGEASLRQATGEEVHP
jgi:outer membrane protein TolC